MKKFIDCKRTDFVNRQMESGNVLFLILIAVALFAALSYAVTQSSRSGGGSVAGEKSLVSSSELTQYPAGIRTSILRMIVSNSLTVDDLEFNTPSDFGSGKEIDDTISPTTEAVKQSVFHPQGGGATYQRPSPELMADSSQVWHFNQENSIPNIGSSKNDLIAFLPGVNKLVCQQVDTQLGVSSVPTVVFTYPTDDQLKSGGTQSAPIIAPDPTTDAKVTTANLPTGSAALAGQPFACVDNGSGVFTYYHVLIEQ